jgi:hypothetical protein
MSGIRPLVAFHRAPRPSLPVIFLCPAQRWRFSFSCEPRSVPGLQSGPCCRVRRLRHGFPAGFLRRFLCSSQGFRSSAAVIFPLASTVLRSSFCCYFGLPPDLLPPSSPPFFGSEPVSFSFSPPLRPVLWISSTNF